MAEPRLPLPAQVHAAVAQALGWVWPRGAARAYADAIASAPRSAELHFRRGDALGRAGCWHDAAHAFASAARLKPSSVEYQGALVVALAQAKRDRPLVEALRRFAQLRPGEGEVHVLLGAVLRRCGRKAEALRAFRLAVRLEGPPRTRRFVLGETLLGNEGWREALAAWNEARQIEAASGSHVLRDAGGRSALNFHPGPLMGGRAPRRPPPVPARGPFVWLRERRAKLRSAALFLLRREWHLPGRDDRVKAIQRAWRKAHPGAVPRKAAAIGVGLALALVTTAAPAADPPAAAGRGETPAAREQARLCERLGAEEGLAACRSALALGIGPERRGPVREMLAKRLVALERWEELADLLRENVQLEPQSAAAWERLGLVLLFALDQPAEAIGALEEATRLAPADASVRLGLGLALQAGRRPKEAVAAIEEALRLDPAALDGRPAARALLDAARRGEAWP
ncbi:MAG TPA: tetratricopeptide repeat protein [Vicinamibacteria bacterium]|nr:tetratricopeptide repeat protein [Vicinamibacteria bacterium]